MGNDQKIEALRIMVADVNLAPSVRHEAAVRLARLIPSVEDQIGQFVALLPAETVEALAWDE